MFTQTLYTTSLGEERNWNLFRCKPSRLKSLYSKLNSKHGSWSTNRLSYLIYVYDNELKIVVFHFFGSNILLLLLTAVFTWMKAFLRNIRWIAKFKFYSSERWGNVRRSLEGFRIVVPINCYYQAWQLLIPEHSITDRRKNNMFILAKWKNWNTDEAWS